MLRTYLILLHWETRTDKRNPQRFPAARHLAQKPFGRGMTTKRRQKRVRKREGESEIARGVRAR